MNVGRQVGNLVITFMLAWLLGPDQFGIIAIAMVYVGFIQVVMQQGMGAALVQRRDLLRTHLDSGFWLVVGTAVVLSVVALAASGWWASFNEEPGLEPVTRALTPLLLLRALIVVPDALLRRDLRFRPLALRTNLSVAGGGIAGVVAAILGAGVWALVVQQLVATGLEVAVVWIAVDWRPRLAWSRTAIGDLLSFSWRSTIASFGVFANARVDALIVGFFLGSTIVGLYRLAARLVDTVLDSISGALQAVSLPELARLQGDPDALRHRLRSLLRISSAASFVPLAALAAASPAIVGVLGPEWEAAEGAIALLAVAGVGRVVGQLVGPFLQAAGRPGYLAVLTWAAAVVSAGTLFVVARSITALPIADQVIWLAVAALATHGPIFLTINLALMGRMSCISPMQLGATLVPGLAAGSLAYVVGRAIERGLDEIGANPLFRTLLTGGTSFLIAAAGVALIEPDVRRFVGRQLAARGQRC